MAIDRMIPSNAPSKAFSFSMKSVTFLCCATSLALLFGAPVQSTAAARRDVSGVRTILAIGDSLTDGYGLSRSQAYPALLAEKLRKAGYKYDVINAGVSGDTTGGGLRRISKFSSQKIDILIVELGINDAFRGVPVEQMRANLQGIIDRTRERNPDVKIIIAGMQLPLYGADSYVRAFGEMFSELAEKNGAGLVPYLLQGVGGDPSLNLPDRIHPNAAGQRVLAENVWRALEPLAQKATAAASRRVE